MGSINLMMDALWNAPSIRRRLVMSGLAIALATCVTACGGDDNNNNNGGPNPTPIRVGDRLAWDQAATSPQQVQALTFKLYVDNVESAFLNTRCASASTAAGYECSGALPSMSSGRHVLELTSVLNGIESGRSTQFTVTVSASSQAPLSSSPALRPDESAASACVIEPGGVCYEVRVIATGLESVAALSPTPDGRVFFIEGDRQISTIAGDAVVSPPALILSNPVGSRIVGLATDSHFERTRSVFVAWTENAPDGSPTLNITRYRELQNTLGEGATIVTGLPFRDGALAPLAVDDDGLLYVAMPVAPRSSLSRNQLDTGVVLRFTREGLVPRGNRRSSPILASGYASPTGLALDSSRGRVWLAGDDSLGKHGLASFSGAMTENAPWPVRPNFEDQAKLPQGLSRVESPTRVPSLESSGPDPVLQVTERNSVLLIATANRLFRGSLAAGGLSDFVEMKFAANTQVLAATGDVNGLTYVVSRDASASATSILQLKRR